MDLCLGGVQWVRWRWLHYLPSEHMHLHDVYQWILSELRNLLPVFGFVRHVPGIRYFLHGL